jgi:hypothetical protein
LKLTRRALLAWGGGALASAVSPAQAQRPGTFAEPAAIDVRGYPFEHFSTGERGRSRFGALTFRSGVELQSDDKAFGGFSGLWRSPEGGEIVAVTDAAQWLTARVTTANGRLSGLSEAVMAPVLGGNGRPLRRTRSYDAEGLTIVNGVAYLAIERTQEVMRFAWAKEGVRARGQNVAVPPEVKELPRNKGLEAIGVAPARSPIAGALVVIAEQVDGEEGAPTRGFILTGPRKGAFDVARSGEYDVTDLAFLGTGEMLLLERRFSVLRGVAARIRRIPAGAIAPGAVVDGPVIFQADGGYQIDNMEGMAVHRDPSGAAIVTLISDNNFSVLQRTLLLEFELAA